MEEVTLNTDTEFNFPVLLIPRSCTKLETDCEATDNVFIDLNITSLDIEGNTMCIYSGFCNVKLIDSYDVDIQDSNSQSSDSFDDNPIIVSEAGNQIENTTYSQSQVWIDPTRSPFVYNSYDSLESQERYAVYHQSNTRQITVEQRSTFITQNVYNYKEATADEFEHKKFRKNALVDQTAEHLYKDDEFECGVFLSQLSEEINEKGKLKEDRRAQNGGEALKQLMSTDIQSVSKQQKTIMYLGNDSHSGQTIQKIAIDDPTLQCIDNVPDNDFAIKNVKPNKKKYQCDNCKQIFDQLATFKHHMVRNHKTRMIYEVDSLDDIKFICTECGKTFKNQDKFDLHCQGHGDPDLECNKCHKVFASKFTLRTHRKIHLRKYSCEYCLKSYSNMGYLRSHMARIHKTFMCQFCDFTCDNQTEINIHRETHDGLSEIVSSDTESAGSFVNRDIFLSNEDLIKKDDSFQDKVKRADSVITKIINNEIFHMHSKKARRHKRYNKTCDVCNKIFDRIGDLKRHLIEHVIRSTLAKTPVNKNGTLTIQCEVCLQETFTKVDKYKAHLREHAKLTLYKCTFCDKSFSDSSNFSKHKKIHGTTFFQCDLCQRKFNSKKMIAQHMEYHQNNAPIPCYYCEKEFHFESMLNKHIKCAHTREVSKFRCKFCSDNFRSLKEKWDHEWKIHNARKIIVDCLICGAKFRKYSELKRHCSNVHNMEIPLAKKLMKN